MKDRQILRVIFLGVFAIAGIICLQAYWVINTWNLNEEEFNQKIHRVLYNVAESLATLNNAKLPQRDLIKKRSSNYFIVNIESEIDPPMLEFFLQKELETQALNLDFEYAVFDCNSNQMVYGNYCSYDPERSKNVHPSELPGHHGFTYYFGVRFPTRSGYLLGQMQVSAVFTGILLVTVLFFVYAMAVILQQKRLTEMQKAFINNMTHEFKTPLSTVQIAADVFLKTPQIQQDPRLKQYAEIIREQNARLTSQVERVLQVARFGKNQLDLKREWLDAHEVLQSVVISENLRAEEKGGIIRLNQEADNARIFADHLHLTNILHSILDNSIKYCNGCPEIVVISQNEGNALVISIVDKGIGIPPEHQHRIFDQFFRVPTGDIHNVKGFGLGLFYVRKICQAHGWKLHLKSAPGKGTAVSIRIPQKQKPALAWIFPFWAKPAEHTDSSPR